MKLSDCRFTDESFTHVTNDNIVTAIYTSALDRYLRRNLTPPEWVNVTLEQATSIMRNHGVEPAHLDRLALKHDAVLSRPVIFCEWKADGTYILADGNHRLVYPFFRANRKEVLGWLVPQSTWEKFTLDLPAGMDIHTFAEKATERKFPRDVNLTLNHQKAFDGHRDTF
jgi:hypothetical protein